LKNNTILKNDFQEIEKFIYQKCHFKYSLPESEEEGLEYGAGTFHIENLLIKIRTSKITPKKVGQFVTLWKRDSSGVTCPYSSSDPIHFVVINTRKDNLFGQFVFPSSILEKHGILSSQKSKGKRGFRIYPPWDKAKNFQAIKTQEWQLPFFLEIHNASHLDLARKLYYIL
jgi:hypothetical protein